jgi:plastocyanin
MNENRQAIHRNRWKRPLVLVAAACAVGAAGLTGCSSPSTAGGSDAAAATSGTTSSGTSPSASAGTPSTATTIMIEKFQYKVPASVSPGATVAVMNMDGEAHTVTSDKDGTFAVQVPPGKTVTFSAPSTAGSFDFHCEYHANMHGTLVVK